MAYDAIGKVETFDEDFRFIVHSAGLKEELPEAAIEVKMNSVPHTDNRGKDYFESLDYGRKMQLFRLYEFDFQLFGYTVEGYL